VVRNIVIDLYANNADVLVEGDLGIDLFQRYVRIQMLRDDHTGRFVCNVLESEQFDVAGDGKVKIKLSNGYLDKKGIHLNGYLSFEFSDGTEESFVISDAGFNNLVIPPQPKADSGQILPRDAYDFKTTAILTKPYSVKFHDFPMELRSLELSAQPLPSTAPQPPSSGYQGMRYSADITFFGGMQLAEKLQSIPTRIWIESALPVFSMHLPSPTRAAGLSWIWSLRTLHGLGAWESRCCLLRAAIPEPLSNMIQAIWRYFSVRQMPFPLIRPLM
jgi:hypothetical protein